ncbi:MAG: fumarate reductase/succinate dehydrogenase flavoprotein domain protein [Chitinophagaceae bacterium]|nr:fumarate reductase/succinate dehydrogenase flavoprotein domain protein [Chitinophagaceae bacterium]
MVFDVIIIGGGLSGLINARLLALNNISVAVIEKNTYPFHRVCGEYISNEVRSFLESIDCFPSELQPTRIERLQVTAPSGFSIHTPLAMGGFGISRYAYDHFLKERAIQAGATVIEGEQIYEVNQDNQLFLCKSLSQKEYKGKLVIGAQGKRSMMDKQLNRSFIKRRSPYIGVKYHIQTTGHPEDLIALHNFQDGYCGISKIENETYCLCYLTTRENLRKHGTIPKMEEAILYKNPFLKNLFTESEFIYKTPEVINEISFAPKTLSDQHVIFCGDAAGMIAPLCGNGMAMAMHSAKILSESILAYRNDFNETKILKRYQKEWNKHFQQRLWIGRTVQKMFGQNTLTEMTLRALAFSPALLRWIISKTHGSAIKVE